MKYKRIKAAVTHIELNQTTREICNTARNRNTSYACSKLTFTYTVNGRWIVMPLILCTVLICYAIQFMAVLHRCMCFVHVVLYLQSDYRNLLCWQLVRLQSLSGHAPLYLTDDCCLVSDSTRRSLQSADVTTCQLACCREHSAVTATELLQPLDLACVTFFRSSCARNPEITYGLFRRQLKGHIFREAWTRRSVTFDMRRLKTLITYLQPFK